MDEPLVEVEEKLPEIRDSKTGRFVKGNDAHARLYIKKKAERAAPILAAITDEFDPDEIGVMLRRAWNTALAAEDWRGQLEVLRFVASYAIGKPITRAIGANVTRDDFLSFFRPKQDDDDEEVIDVESS